jgi:hypothetical protein
MTSNKFTWGDSVLIRIDSTEVYHPGGVGSICGMRNATAKESADSEEGTVIYVVEFADGSSMEIPERYIELFNGKSE